MGLPHVYSCRSHSANWLWCISQANTQLSKRGIVCVRKLLPADASSEVTFPVAGRTTVSLQYFQSIGASMFRISGTTRSFLVPFS